MSSLAQLGKPACQFYDFKLTHYRQETGKGRARDVQGTCNGLARGEGHENRISAANTPSVRIHSSIVLRHSCFVILTSFVRSSFDISVIARATKSFRFGSRFNGPAILG